MSWSLFLQSDAMKHVIFIFNILSEIFGRWMKFDLDAKNRHQFGLVFKEKRNAWMVW